MSEQPSLFSYPTQRQIRRQSFRCREQGFALSATGLQDWQRRVFAFQQQVQPAAMTQQQLFAPTEPTSVDVAAPDPFSLPAQPTEFWRWQPEGKGEPALYFVIDYQWPILLYIGETVQSEQRWRGVHGCKEYLSSYQDLHYRHQLPTQLGICFWREAPQLTRPRQRLESQLIYRWRSPFNKENWQYWRTPFVHQNASRKWEASGGV